MPSRRDPRHGQSSEDEASGPTESVDHRRPLQRAHVVVAVIATAAALIGTAVVLVNAQPVSEDVAPDGPGAPVAPAEGDLPPEWSQPLVATSAPAGAPRSSPSRLVVHVVGDVVQPGVVRLAMGSRVEDAIDAAGGSTDQADLSTVNLARVLVDGEQVRVGLPPVPSTALGTSGAGTDAAGLLSLNTATAAQLTELPGIGPVLAARIIEHRAQEGPFQRGEHLLDVAGIGPAVLDDIHGRVQL